MLNQVIKNAKVHDGVKFLPSGTSVGIQNGTLKIFHPGENPEAEEVFNAEGLILSPAFIDCHNHGDLRILSRKGINLLSQGVATVVVGNCGFSPWESCMNNPVFLEDTQYSEFSKCTDYMNALRERKSPLNVYSLAGIEALLPLSRAQQNLAQAMDSGCRGLSVGLTYPRQKAIEKEDIIKLGRVLKKHASGSVIVWHLRNQGEKLAEAVREVISVYKALEIPSHISHLKRIGLENPGAVDEILEMLSPYTEISFDMYPYTESWSTFESIYTAGEELCGKNATAEEKALSGCRSLCPDAWADIIPVSGMPEEYLYQHLDKNAEKKKTRPLDLYLELMRKYPNATACFLKQCCESDYMKVFRSNNGFVASDGHIYDLEDKGHHPRSFGSFSKFLKLCWEKKWLPLEEAVRKLTSAPAERFNLTGHGYLKDGLSADICIWDPGKIKDKADFEHTTFLSEGIRQVYVKGKKVYQKEQ